MYPPALAQTLRAAGIEATTVAALGLAGRSDTDVFAAATTGGWVLLTENVADFARIAAEHLAGGSHHRGVLLALSSRFSRRPHGIPALAAAVRARVEEHPDDRLVYLEQPPR